MKTVPYPKAVSNNLQLNLPTVSSTDDISLCNICSYYQVHVVI